MVIIMQPTIQQLIDIMALSLKLFLRSLNPFTISFLNINNNIRTYIKSVKANNPILGILGILLMFIPKILLMILMFAGRVGVISILGIFMKNKKENTNVEYVSGNLVI